MAEAQRRFEAITIEIEELSQTGLLSDEECRCILKKTMEYENKINSMQKSLQDFTEYIAYTTCCSRMITVRRAKLNISEKKHHLDYHIMQRVKNLYEMAADRFPLSIDLFLNFFKFCKETNFEHASDTMCKTMLRHHRNNEQAWLTAARLAFHGKNDTEYAITLLQKGISIQKSSAILYTECIKYEMIAMSHQKTVEKHQIICKKLEVYIKEAKKHIKSYIFYTDLLSFLNQYTFAQQLQIGLVKYLLEVHKNNAAVWNNVAHEELNGNHYNMDEDIVEQVSPKKGFQYCVAMFEKGLQTIGAENLPKLWTAYLNCLVAQNNRPYMVCIADYHTILINAFQRASDCNCMIEKFYFVWLDLLNVEKKQELLKCATEKKPFSVDLWALRLRISTVVCDHEKVVEIFRSAIAQLKENSISVWEVMQEYYIEKRGKNEIKAFYHWALSQEHEDVVGYFKPRFIVWLANTEKTLKTCREMYKRIVNDSPFCKQMYDVMWKLEEKYLFTKASDDEFVEFLLQTACEQFGVDSYDVWINLIMYITHGSNVKEKNRNRLPRIFYNAKNTLRKDLHEEFDIAYDDVLEVNVAKRMRLDDDACSNV